ncbi:hypothetical protein B0H63DRAFT_481576 [Podospora didyma]|uniref:AMP-activated protein kinase glycogen-binding domain-containing protein n=1 Tax=Podospora didyma TaxID=330526 RepID=A0AAE0N9G2_9PEZI|nr:hypothetical protein B0H63DRAFT_481576 [Podospora didyma]
MTSAEVVVPTTITYQKSGTNPPIFVAGTFSDPPWQPQEMNYTTDTGGEHTFKKEVFAKPGSKIQYKFRVGSGDWWVLDEATAAVTDSSGFKNNEMEVQPLKRSSNDHEQAESLNKQGGAVGDTPQPKPPKVDNSRLNPADNLARVTGDSDPHSGTGTPIFARIAAEVGESAALLDRDEEPESGKLAEHDVGDKRPTRSPTPFAESANTAAEVGESAALLDREKLELPKNESRPHPSASTIELANTAAEVGETAALLDREELKSQKSDEESRSVESGPRSATPIAETATTAAEVADTAQTLDEEAAIELEVRPDSFNPEEYAPPEDQDEHGEHKPPLFSYECAGLYEDEEDHQGINEPDQIDHHEEGSPKQHETGFDDIDVNDPTLERFPSNREEIIDTVRKIETGLGEDRAVFEAVPPSPIVTSSRRGTEDLIFGDHFLSSPVATTPVVVSPIVPRPSRHLGVPRSPRGSISSAHSSAISLQSISEGEEPSGSEENRSSPVALFSTPPKPSSFDALEPGSDEDEGIGLSVNSGYRKPYNGGLLAPETAASPWSGARSPPEPVSDTSDVSPMAQTRDGKASESPFGEQQVPGAPNITSPGRGHSQSPRIVINTADDGPESDGSSHQATADGQAKQSDDADGETVDGVTTSTMENRTNTNQLRKRKRGTQGDQPDTPASTHSAGIPGDHKDGWIRAFFRLLFVDLIGGFFTRLCGGRRKT